MQEHMTQHERIMDYLNRRTRDGKHFILTPMKAFTKLNITKVSKRVGELIAMGHSIYKVPVCKRKKDGTTIRYMSYTLDKPLDKPEEDNGRLHKDIPKTA